MQNRCVVRNSIDDFVLVGPPIRKTAGIDPVRFHFVGHFESLQNVGERIDLEAYRICNLHQHVDFGLHIRMAGNMSFVVTDFLQGLQSQVFAVNSGILLP